MILITGGKGLLGSALHKEFPEAPSFNFRLEGIFPALLSQVKLAFLCAGTKGHAECEGNAEAFRADVDGNIRLGRQLLKQGAFVVFISTDAVERTQNTAYARNRFYVELALGGQPGVAIVRPGRFDSTTAKHVARLCADVGRNHLEGLHRWP